LEEREQELLDEVNDDVQRICKFYFYLAS